MKDCYAGLSKKTNPFFYHYRFISN